MFYVVWSLFVFWSHLLDRELIKEWPIVVFLCVFGVDFLLFVCLPWITCRYYTFPKFFIPLTEQVVGTLRKALNNLPLMESQRGLSNELL